MKIIVGITSLCMIVVGLIIHYTAMHNVDLSFNAETFIGRNWTDISIAGVENTPEEIHLMSMRMFYFSPLLMIFGGLLFGMILGGRK